jgi:putative transposase
LPKGIEETNVEIWFQDEHRIGQQGSLTRIWARKGTRPRAPRQQQFISAYIFGAVCPEKDKGAAVIMPQANTASMQAHIDEIDQQVEKGKHAVIVLDKAGWHTSKNLRIPKNISLLPLPPYSPELNPQEQVGRQMKHNDLANRNFNNYNDIVEACSQAWMKIVSTQGAIRSLCSRAWAII